MVILHQLLLPLLIPLSWIYGLIIWIRNRLFDIGFFKSKTFKTPIISIGNITTGGTGKTPMVIYLTKLLKKNNYKPGIVSRGYGRNSTGLIMVHDGNKLLTDIDKAGDEPYLLGEKLNNIPIIVCENRIDGIQKLLENRLVDIIILDDAFQHRYIERDLDIVLISSNDKIGDYHLLPWGKLREPLYVLKRAQCIIYSKTKQFQNPSQHEIINPNIITSPITNIIQPIIMKMGETGYKKVFSVDEPVFAFCGIGDSNSFVQTANELGLKIIGTHFFQDHQNYNTKILQRLSIQIQNSKCKAVITTEKDKVKIPESFMKKFIFYVIKIDVVFENDSVVLDLIKPLFSQSSKNNRSEH